MPAQLLHRPATLTPIPCRLLPLCAGRPSSWCFAGPNPSIHDDKYPLGPGRTIGRRGALVAHRRTAGAGRQAQCTRLGARAFRATGDGACWAACWCAWGWFQTTMWRERSLPSWAFPAFSRWVPGSDARGGGAPARIFARQWGLSAVPEDGQLHVAMAVPQDAFVVKALHLTLATPSGRISRLRARSRRPWPSQSRRHPKTRTTAWR